MIPRERKPEVGPFVVWLLPLLLVGLLIVTQWGFKYPWANDSAGYIQEARGLLEGRGLTRVAPWNEPNATWSHFPLFPPGFSLFTAAFAALGIAPDKAALAISWLAWLGMGPAVIWAARPLIGSRSALIVALLIVSSPGFLEWGFQALSDAPMTVFSILSLGLLTRARILSELAVQNWLIAGAFAGVAYLFRNAGAVLPLSIIAFLAYSWLTQQLTLWQTIRSGLAWGCGFAICAFPLFMYNLVTFGSIQPYFGSHGVIDYGVLSAVRISLWSLLLDFSGWHAVAELAWNAKGLLAITPFALMATWWISRRHQPTFTPGFILLTLYAGIGCALVIWGRSRFDWVESTLTRQMIPYTWAWFILGTWALYRLAFPRYGSAAWLVVALLVAGRVTYLTEDMARDRSIQDAVRNTGYFTTAQSQPDWILTSRIKLDIATDATLHERIHSLPDDTYLLSNQAALLSITTGRPIRSIAPEYLSELHTLRKQLGTQPLVLVITTDNHLLHKASGPLWQEERLTQLGKNVTELYRSSLVLMVRYP